MKHPLYMRIMMVLASVAVVGFFAGLWLDFLWLRLLCKPVPVLVLILLLWRADISLDGKAIVGGLSLSIVGDILLEVPANLFVPGLLAFLLAHLCYIFAFVQRSRALHFLWLLPFGLWCGGIFVWMLPALLGKKLLFPVAVYVTVICLMMWRAAAALKGQDRASQVALAGALLFAFSDSCIAVNKFISPFMGARELIIATYWLGQFGIAYSVLMKGRSAVSYQ